ncbi:hypothetical protein SH1V18_03330 [Vallitalea longa]|uniref:Portal protein n=1 Tax=Vallitalea longa TaxID=2936439 RepID=A0A9W5YAR4_9FIRM|nr:hypothetical protein [Vallitalea longa]GKX27853.1 hypothetical protein SH1V18_03330 [Vallitalea longa]
MTKAWKRYQEGLNFMRTDGLIDRVQQNERFIAGDQWYGIKSRDLPKPVLNIIKRIVNFKVSSVMSEEVKMNFSVQGYSAGVDSENAEKYEEAADLFTRYSDATWENIKQTPLSEQILKDAATSGAGIIHYFWDNTIKTGNDVKAIGELVGEIIDCVNYFPSNPNDNRIQSQPSIIISYRELVSKLKEEASNNEVSKELIDLIQGDKDTNDEAFEKAKDELGDKTTVLLEYSKRDGEVFYSKSTQNVEIVPETSTGLSLYPLVLMNWETRKRSCYGVAEVTELIPNQTFINKTLAMWMLSAQRTAFPKAIYDKTRIKSISNAIGHAIGVHGDISNVFKYAETGSTNYDVFKLIEFVMDSTKEVSGANENAMGEAKADNQGALMLQQQASAVPIESIKRRYFQALEDIGLIWADFWKAKYNTERLINVSDEDGNQETLWFLGEDYKDVKLNLKLDIGPSTHWSEAVTVNMIGNWLQTGMIDLTEALEMLPNNVIPNKQRLIEKRKQADIEKQVLYKCMTEFVDSLPPEEKEEIEKLKPDEMEQKILSMMSN